MEEKEFNDKYWLTNLKLAIVVNPLHEDYKFQCAVETGVELATGRPKTEVRTYIVKAGGSERFPAPVANLYLKQMSQLLAQDDNTYNQYIDYSHRAELYDRLIVEIIDMVESYQPFNSYKEEGKVEEKVEQPFANVNEEVTSAKRIGRPPKTPISEG